MRLLNSINKKSKYNLNDYVKKYNITKITENPTCLVAGDDYFSRIDNLTLSKPGNSCDIPIYLMPKTENINRFSHLIDLNNSAADNDKRLDILQNEKKQNQINQKALEMNMEGEEIEKQ